MNPVATQQVALDNSLVAPEKRLKIEKCDARIVFSKPQREETYQVTLDALKDKTISMRNRIKLHTIRDDSLLGTLIFVSKTQDYQHYGALIPDDITNQDVKDSKAYKTYYDFATRKATPKKARKFKKVDLPSRKLSLVLEEEPTEKPKRARKPTKKSTTVLTTGVVIRDTPRTSMPKKKTPAKVDRGKGMDLLSNAALLKAAQVPDESEDKTTGTNEGTGAILGVPDVPKYLSESENKSWGDSGDDESNNDDNDDVTKNDDEDDVEKEHEEEYVRTPDSFEFNNDDEEYDELYKDVNVRSKVAEHKEVGKGDAEMTDTTHGSSKQSSSVSSDFASKFRNLDNVPPVIDEVASMMNVKTPHEESSTQASLNLSSYTTEFEKKALAEKEKYIDIIEKSVKEIIKDEVKSQLPQILPKEISDFATSVIQRTIDDLFKNVVLAKSSSQPQSTYEAATSLTEFEQKKIMLDKLEKTYSLKRGREDNDKDKDPPTRSDQGLKKRKTSKDAEPSRGSKSKEYKSSSSKGSKPQLKSSGKSAKSEEPIFETTNTEMRQDQGDELGNTKDQPNVEEDSKHDGPPQTWISKMAKARKPPTTFKELMSTPIDFSAYVLHNLKIENLTQEHLVGPAFNLLKGTCKSRVELNFN
ncbi:hypothetical protein Tco_0518974 [Tanacetum coccineum]